MNLIAHSLGNLLISEIAKQYEQAKTIIALDPPSELNKVNLGVSVEDYDLDYRNDVYNDREDYLTPFRDVTQFSLAFNGDPSFFGNERFASYAHHSILMNFGHDIDLGSAHGMVLESLQNLIDPTRASFAKTTLFPEDESQYWQEDSIKRRHEGLIYLKEPEGKPENSAVWQSEELPAPDYLLFVQDGSLQVFGTNRDDAIDGNKIVSHGDDYQGLSILLKGDRGDDYLIAPEKNLYGLTGENTLEGGKGNDTLEAINSTNNLDGGKGQDLLLGGEDDDQLMGKDGSDTLIGGEGRDIMLGGYGDDVSGRFSSRYHR